MLSVLDTLSELPALREAVGAAPVASGDTLELAAELGRGSFGCVSGCSVAGRRGAPTAVKRFHDASGERNLRVVADLHRALADLGRDDLSRLRGAPYWAGHLTEGAGPPRPAWLAADLAAAGYRPLADVLADDDGWRRLLGLPLPDRLRLAAAFADGCAVLDGVGFVHADMNADNVVVDLDTLDAVLLDVDSGMVRGAPGASTPLTVGKLDEFCAPEVVGPSGVPELSRVNDLSERWAIDFVVSYLLFGVHPLFFLRSTGADVVGQYLAAHTWPHLPLDSDLFLAPNAEVYRTWLDQLDELPPAVRDALAAVVDPGAAQPGRRPSACDWALALAAVPPWFDLVHVDEVVLAGRPATVRWHAPTAAAVEIVGVGTCPGKGTENVVLPRSARLRLVARNAAGEADAVTPLIRVVAAPVAPRVYSANPPRMGRRDCGRPSVPPSPRHAAPAAGLTVPGRREHPPGTPRPGRLPTPPRIRR